MLHAGSVGSSWHRAIPGVILAVGVSLSFLLFHMATVAEEQRIRSVLELNAEWRSGDVKHKFLDTIDAVEATAALVSSLPEVPRDDVFQRFATKMRADDPVVRITWTPWIAGEARESFERQGRPITLCTADGQRVSAPEHPAYAPVQLEALFMPQPSLLGCDLLSVATRAAVAEQARDRGEGVLSAPLRQLSGWQPAPSVVMIWPVYRDGITPPTVEERRAKIAGFVSGSIRVDALLSFAVRDTLDSTETLYLFAGNRTGNAAEVPLVTYRPDRREFEIAQQAMGEPSLDGLRLVRSFEVGGQSWTLVFDVPPTAIAALGTSPVWLYLVLCLLVTALLCAYVVAEQRRRFAVETKVVERTRDLQATNDQLKAIIDASPLAIISLDPEQRVRIWNEAAEQIFGYTEEEVIGTTVPIIPPEHQAEFEDRFQKISQGQILRRLDGIRLRKDGSTFEASVSIAPKLGPDGRFLGGVALIEDVTERNRTQRQLAHAQKMETVGQLTGGLAHDFNNILGAVIGNLDLLESRVTEDPMAAGYCQGALEAALSAAELVKRLLVFSRRQQLWPTPTAVDQTIANLAPLLKRTLGEHIRVETTVEDGLWLAVTDTAQLESVLLNLAVNARDAMPGGGLLAISAANATVDDSVAQTADGLTPGAYVVIAVSDSGTGMSAEVLAHALEPFYTTKAPGAGSGLGLSMVFGTMRQLGGTIKIYSEVGLGTTVRLYLPRASSEGGKAGPADLAPPALPTGSEHILLVEDNAQVRTVGLGILRDLGYHVTTAENGDEALHLVEAGLSFDLLFSDIVMPGKLNGIALAQAIRTRWPDIPIVLASGFTNPEAVKGTIGALGATLIAKPFRKAQLATLIRDRLDGRQEARG